MKEGEIEITGLLGPYVDDCILGGNESFQVLKEKMHLKFDLRPREWDNVEFLVVTIETLRTNDERLISVNQICGSAAVDSY